MDINPLFFLVPGTGLEPARLFGPCFEQADASICSGHFEQHRDVQARQGQPTGENQPDGPPLQELGAGYASPNHRSCFWPMKKPIIEIIRAMTDNTKPIYAHVPGATSMAHLDSLMLVKSNAPAAKNPQAARNSRGIDGSGNTIGPTVNVNI